MAKGKKEAEFIDTLISRIESQYKRFIRNHHYDNGREYGEADLLALHSSGKIDVYEIKASRKHYDKAKIQLDKAKRLIPNVQNCYLYIGREDVIISEADL